MRARIPHLIIAVCLAAAPAVMVATPANASSTCYGDYCSGQDPEATHCASDAVTTKYKDVTGGQLQVRWSPTCKTNWARLVIYPGTRCLDGGDLTARQDTGYTQSKWLGVIYCNDNTTEWSPMIYSPVHHVRAEYDGYTTAWS